MKAFIRDRGQDIVEFALLAPLLFLLLFGIIEFGVAVFRYNTLSNAVREGARAAVVRPRAQRECIAWTAVTEALGAAGIATSSLCDPCPEDATCGACNLASSDICLDISQEQGVMVDTITVEVTYKYYGITGAIINQPITMHAVSTMVAE